MTTETQYPQPTQASSLTAQLLDALKEAADYTRHPDYDWPVEFSRQVRDLIARAETQAPEGAQTELTDQQISDALVKAWALGPLDVLACDIRGARAIIAMDRAIRPAPAEGDERAAFEREMCVKWPFDNRLASDPTKYVSPEVQGRWEAWQARAALASKPQPGTAQPTYPPVPITRDPKTGALLRAEAAVQAPAPVAGAVPDRLVQAFKRGDYRVPETLDEAIASAANIMIEDRIVIEHLQAKVARLSDTQAPAVGDGIEELADFLGNTLGLNGDVDDAAAEIVALLSASRKLKEQR